MTEAIVIRGGKLADGTPIDVRIEDGRIAAVGSDVAQPPPAVQSVGVQTIDARGLIVAPGFVDLHTHLREPGLEYKEDIESGTRAAARGGFTTVCAMPNTEPAMDNRSIIEHVLREAQTRAHVRVLPIGAVSKGRQGRELAELADLQAAGCVAFSDDGAPVWDATLMRRALEYANGLDLAVIDHCEDPSLAKDAVMHEGWVSTRLGLRGAPAAAEGASVARDIALAEITGAHVHIAHVSTRAAIETIRAAKARGVRVTAEVTPHHLTLTHEIVAFGAHGSDELVYDTNAKVNPPLRSQDDVDACIEALADGTIDCIATDHAPHAVIEKLCEFDDAAFGISGLETAFALCMRLVHDGCISLETLIARMTIGPVRALGLDRIVPGLGTLDTGPNAPADIVLLDPNATWTVEPERFASKGKNTPLAGVTLTGAVIMTIASGRIAYSDPQRLTTNDYSPTEVPVG